MPTFRHSKPRRLRGWFVVAAIVLISLGAVAWASKSYFVPLGVSTEFQISQGDGEKQVIRLLAENALGSPFKNTLLLHALSLKSKLIRSAPPHFHYGEYEVKKEDSLYGVFRKVLQGRKKTYALRLIDGHTSIELLKTLQNTPLKDNTLPSPVLKLRLNVPYPTLEGAFLADTYFYERDASAIPLLSRMHQSLEKTLEAAWAHRAQGLPFRSPYEALIMASIIEKETGSPEERPRIAAVFINRLKQGMKLQTDPTVIYGMGLSFDGNLRKKDLRGPSPYNTYVHYGLPPTPICNVGKEAILAALNPMVTDELYFVAMGNGRHYFSRTLEEHNAAVNRYQKHPAKR